MEQDLAEKQNEAEGTKAGETTYATDGQDDSNPSMSANGDLAGQYHSPADHAETEIPPKSDRQ